MILVDEEILRPTAYGWAVGRLDHGLWVGHGNCIHMRVRPVAYGWATGEISLMMLRPRAYGWALGVDDEANLLYDEY